MKSAINVAMYRYHVQRLAKAEKPGCVVEVGVYCGDLSRLLSALPGLKRLILVDAWRGSAWKDQAHMDLLAQSVEAWARTDERVHVLRQDSVKAAKSIADASVDFFHLDGAHDYASVAADLAAWRSKIRPGGLMTGDNYEAPDVARAVVKAFGKSARAEGKGRIWVVQL